MPTAHVRFGQGAHAHVDRTCSFCTGGTCTCRPHMFVMCRGHMHMPTAAMALPPLTGRGSGIRWPLLRIWTRGARTQSSCWGKTWCCGGTETAIGAALRTDAPTASLPCQVETPAAHLPSLYKGFPLCYPSQTLLHHLLSWFQNAPTQPAAGQRPSAVAGRERRLALL
jgi:hypothetical protein